MDVKSLAKSKRAHSQHHSKKRHSKPATLKAPSPVGGANSTNKQFGKGVGDKLGQSHSVKGLPSNQDRYEEDYELDVNDKSKGRINSEIDRSIPKSKGADYMYLLSEAKLQSDANILSEGFPSFDNVFSDFNEGFGSLLSARGKGILSWSGDDNFIVEDKATASHEASFLSLNLHLLAEQLEKVDLPTRLFMEPDLFLAEKSSEELRTADEGSDQIQVESQSQETCNLSDEVIDAHPNNDNIKDGEAEVDLLPKSFSNTVFVNSSDPKKYNDRLEEKAFKMDSTSIPNKTHDRNSQRDLELLKSDGVDISFDDDLDNLLKETSSSVSQEISSAQQIQSQPRVKGNFSEHALKMNNFDDDLDDLLVETSSTVKNSRGSSSSNINIDDELDDLLNDKGNLKSYGVDSSSVGSLSKSKLSAFDDFDSFFDTL